MKYQYLILAFFILALSSCGDKKEEKKKIKIELTFKEDPKDGTVNLMNFDNTISKGTAKVIDHKATFEIDTAQAEFYTITFEEQGFVIVAGKKDIKVSNIDQDITQVTLCEMDGSEDIDNIELINNAFRKYLKKNITLKETYKVAEQQGNKIATDSLNKVFANTASDFKKELKAKIEKMIPSIASLYALRIISQDPAELAFSKSMVDKLKKETPNSVAVQRVVKAYEYLSKQQQQTQVPQDGLAIGDMAPDFTLNTPEGQAISLSSYRGKYVLIDFWAGWCGPCRGENPNLVNAYNTFKGENFDVLGVSLDKSEKKWIDAIKQDNLTWTQVSDLKYFNSPVVDQYQIQGIPMNFLIDPKGNIVAKNLRGAQLQEVLETTLHHKIRNNE